ncbi:hypothetical protein IWQ57_003209 [Coemansia nantahalensis]|uniref:Uncharacterized protein n=1 Tax=Coemansia nantahalensis TaxID=2789366 RepID=A0ACC1JXV5_9FUNG|nr:hypothetical protein IWQ57_003209 [Coemansia nantahalensis]
MLGDNYGNPGAPQSSAEDALVALNGLLSSMSPAAQLLPMAPSTTTSSQGFLPLLSPSPDSAGSTPAQPSLQPQQQLSLDGLDAMATSAGTGCQDIFGLDLAALLGSAAQPPLTAASGAFGLQTAPATASDGDFLASLAGFMPPLAAGSNSWAAGNDSWAAKRSYGDALGDGAPISAGIPTDKRVSLPASLSPSIGTGGGGWAPRVALRRNASHQPTPVALGAASLSPEALLTCNPIGRASTTTAADRLVSGGGSTAGQFQRKVAHNAIERRYRNNINDRIRDLRNAVPALECTRSKMRSSDSDGAHDSADDLDDAADTNVDGVEAATKLNKATILGKATEYIYYLRRTNDQQRRESLYLQRYIRELGGSDAVVRGLLDKAKRESAAATADLHMPEPAPKPKRRRLC